MQEQTNTTDWLSKEEETFAQTKPKNYDKLPSIKLIQDDIVDIDIDFSKPFEKWHDPVNDVIKAIIPIVQDREKRLWWLNIRNPVYAEIIRAGRMGVTHFRILQTGNAKLTKYKLK